LLVEALFNGLFNIMLQYVKGNIPFPIAEIGFSNLGTFIALPGLSAKCQDKINIQHEKEKGNTCSYADKFDLT